MVKTFQNVKGTFDILPDSSTSDGTRIAGAGSWRYVESAIRDVMARFNLEEIRTPILEETELIARGVGQLTDIVSKEMFVVERGDESYVLRPEITAPVMRAYLQHHLDQRGGVQKLFYVGPCFRAERPQKGRYRQFHQFGCEIIGADDPRADVETIALMLAVYDELGITRAELRVNSLGDVEERRRYASALRTYFEAHRSDLSETSRKRLETSPLRILDTKVETERVLLDDAPVLLDFVDGAGREKYDDVKRLLHDLGIEFTEDPFLVRGLDYYTHTAFELVSPDLGAQSALAGGGRYDLLATELGSSNPVPAVGFAAGIERLFLALYARNVELSGSPSPEVFVVALGEEAVRWAFRRAQGLRGDGLRVGLDLKGRSMKAQMREANRQNARYTLIVGKDELTAGTVQLKDMASGDQLELPVGDVVDYVRRSRGETSMASRIQQ